jgi:hypothetical protein
MIWTAVIGSAVEAVVRASKQLASGRAAVSFSPAPRGSGVRRVNDYQGQDPTNVVTTNRKLMVIHLS